MRRCGHVALRQHRRRLPRLASVVLLVSRVARITGKPQISRLYSELSVIVGMAHEDSDKVLVSGRIDAQGMYGFKPPALEYNVVVKANEGHVASMSSEDIW